MSLRSKQWLYIILCIGFLVMSFGVYTSTENVNRGFSLMSEDVKAGKHLFQKYNCTSCHQIFGLGGYMGPDLTNCMSAEGGPQRADIWLRNGSIKMPDFDLSDQEIIELLAFLSYIDKTGTSPPVDYEINAIGTVDIKHYQDEE